MPDDSIFAPFSIACRDDGTRIELGRGAMGITYAATDTQLGRRVALKVINATFLGDPVARQRFLSEARAAAQLHHSNVAGVYQLRAEGEDIFYAMEFVEGETLESYVKRCGPLPPRLALRVILQAAQGLAAANERGLIHRDIKPANLMLARAPSPAGDEIEHEEDDGLLVKVIDFGLAKSVSGNDTGGGLTGGSVVGTPYYMSPEQISPETGSVLDCRSDIYSLGVTLWYLLVGRAPFEGSQFQILSQHLQKRPPLENLSDAGVPPDIVTLIGSMLAKDRDERPANHSALIAALKKILRGGGSTTFAAVPRPDGGDATMVMPSSSRPSTSQIAPKQVPEGIGAVGRSQWLIPAALGAAALVAIAIWQPWKKSSSTAASVGEIKATPNETEARKLANRSRALIDGDLLAGRENFRLAEELGQKATTLDPTDGETWAIYARALIGSWERNYDSTPQKRELTKMAVERASRLAPDYVETALALSRYQGLVGQKAAAEQTARLSLTRNPNDQRVIRALALACFEMKKESEALELLRRSAAMPGGDAEALIGESDILRVQRHVVEAEAVADRSLALAPSTYGFGQKLALLAFEWGDLDRLFAVIEQLPPRLAQDDYFASIIARYWIWRGEPDRALEVLRRVPRDFFEEQRQFYPKGWITGWALQMAGRTTAAKTEWEQALAVVEKRLQSDPNRVQLLIYRARLLALLGRRSEAEAAQQLVRELEPESNPFRPFNEATFQLCLGDHGAAMTQLLETVSKRAQLRNPGAHLLDFKYDPMFAPIRADPRFNELIAAAEQQLRQLKSDRQAKPAAGAVTLGVDPNSVAVLAFENLSDDKSNEYFSDGVSEELLTVLQKIPGLRVAARTSAFSFKGKNVKAQEIGQQLGVAQLVEGSVRKSGNSVRIAARLSRADTGEQIWSENYTRDLKDVFAVQSEIAQTIVEQLRGRLGGGTGTAEAKAQVQSQVRMAEKGGTKNVEAYQQYLRGRFLDNEFTSVALEGAVEAYRKAVELDPKFALAWAALSETHTLQTSWDASNVPLEDGYQKARLAADRALALEPELPEALLALGRVRAWHDFDWSGAEELARKALQLAPSNALAVGFLSEINAAAGQLGRTIELGRQATALDPLNPMIRLSLGYSMLQGGMYGEAEGEIRRVLELSPGTLGARGVWSVAALLSGRVDDAIAIAEADTPGWSRNYALALAYWQQGKKLDADAALRDLEKSFAESAAYQVGEVYAYRGDRDKAFAWLERACQQRDPGIVALKSDRLLEALHSDPRWATLLRRTGLADFLPK